MMEPRPFYEEQIARLGAEAARLRSYSHRFVAAELSLFVAAVACVAARFWGPSLGGRPWLWLLGGALFLIIYFIVRWRDVEKSERREACERRQRTYERERAYLDGDFSMLADGREYADEGHPFSMDLDLFGTASLFQRIDRTVSSGGADILAAWLGEHEPPCLQAIAERREAIRELAADEPLRTDFLMHGLDGRLDGRSVAKVVSAAREMETVRWPMTTWSLVVAWLAISALALGLVAYIFNYLSDGQFFLWAALQFGVVSMSCSKSVRRAMQVVGAVRSSLERYEELVRLIVEHPMKSVALQHLRDELTGEGRDAVEAFGELKAISDALDRRGNVLAFLLFNTFGLSDYFLVRRYERWRITYVGQMDAWIEAVSRFDTYVSLATFRFNEPLATDAEWAEGESVRFEAQGLWHPFVGADAVRNDFNLKDCHYYIITGANMAGKSTFLRAIGINCVLARMGLPVFAERLTLSRFALFTSMRTTDDLSRGISYFNAELLRLQQLLQAVKDNSLRTLIILDEILKGTNSLDKLNGSRLFLEHIAEEPVTGVVATHDLELSRMADEHPERFHTFCFEISLDADVVYTYRITPGVARNQNATFLLKQLLNIKPTT